MPIGIMGFLVWLIDTENTAVEVERTNVPCMSRTICRTVPTDYETAALPG